MPTKKHIASTEDANFDNELSDDSQDQPQGHERVRLGEALRMKGLDEHAVAEALASVVGKLQNKGDETDGVEKLLVDVLKECCKHLEEDAKASGESPVQVRLIHKVARPKRNKPGTEISGFKAGVSQSNTD